MTENSKEIRKSKLGIAGLVKAAIGLAGILIPILLDYSAVPRLQLQVLTSTKVSESSPGFERLQMLYDGKPIQSILKMTFALANTGRRSISSKDIASPVTLEFKDSARVLTCHIEATIPANSGFTSEVDSNRTAVIIRFPLLNPREVVRFSVLLEGNSSRFMTTARIADLRRLVVVDRRRELDTLRRQPSRYAYVVLVFAILLGIFGFQSLANLQKEVKNRDRYLNLGLSLPAFETKGEWRRFAASELSYLSEKDLERFPTAVESLGSEEKIDGSAFVAIRKEYLALVQRGSDALPNAVIGLALFGSGVTYFILAFCWQ